MNARDGMRRLRAERKAMGLCGGCGAKLPEGYRWRMCDYCLAQKREYKRRYEQRRKDAAE